MSLFEFTVEGPPLSHQTRNKANLQVWRNAVRAAAGRRWAQPNPLSPAIRLDNDNMVKPIQDALIGLVFEDDRQITDTVVRKTDIDGAFVVRGKSLVLLEAFAAGKEFLHIVIEPAPSHSTPLG